MFGKRLRNRWILIIGLMIAGLVLAGCEEEVTEDTTSVSDSNEGTLLAPTDITALMPYNGSVSSGSSYYLISGVALTAVTVNLTALTADADLATVFRRDLHHSASLYPPAFYRERVLPGRLQQFGQPVYSCSQHRGWGDHF